MNAHKLCLLVSGTKKRLLLLQEPATLPQSVKLQTQKAQIYFLQNSILYARRQESSRFLRRISTPKLCFLQYGWICERRLWDGLAQNFFICDGIKKMEISFWFFSALLCFQTLLDCKHLHTTISCSVSRWLCFVSATSSSSQLHTLPFFTLL